MKILVTGATGFVGRPLVAYLAGQGHEVIAVVRESKPLPHGRGREAYGAAVSRMGEGVPQTDSLPQPTPSSVNPGGSPLSPMREKEVVIPDICNADWAPILQGVDAVIHLAARVHQMNDPSPDPLAEFRRVNRDATVALAQAALAAGVKRFVFLSSVKAAVDETGLKAVDELDGANPSSPYGISKLEAETALLAIEGLESVILRPPLIYGPGVKANFRLLVKLARLPVLPLGAIRNRRSMLGLTNLLRAIELSLTAPIMGAWYIDDGGPISTPELLQALAAAMHRKLTLLALPVGLLRGMAKMAGQGEKIDRLTESLVIDGSRFRTATGFQPEPMAKELERLIASLYP